MNARLRAPRRGRREGRLRSLPRESDEAIATRGRRRGSPEEAGERLRLSGPSMPRACGPSVDAVPTRGGRPNALEGPSAHQDSEERPAVRASSPPFGRCDIGEVTRGVIDVPPPDRPPVLAGCSRIDSRCDAARPDLLAWGSSAGEPMNRDVVTRSRTPSRSRSGASTTSASPSLALVSGRIGRVHRGRPVDPSSIRSPR